MVKIKHKQQFNDGYNWTCGAVCLEMIFDYYGIEYNEKDIWDNIKTRRPNALGQHYTQTHKVARYAIEHGLNATVYRAKHNTSLELLEQINNKNIPAILEIREKKSKHGHFVVYTGIKHKMYYYCDPNSEREFSYYKSFEIEEDWSPQNQNDEVKGYFLMVFDRERDEMQQCKNCGESITIVHGTLQSLAEGIACPYCGAATYMNKL